MRLRSHASSSLVHGVLAMCILGTVTNNVLADDWWSMPDAQFFKEYKQLSTGTQKERSTFAWMLFARVNQPATDVDGTAFVAWELWASNNDTFPETGQPTWPGSKNRTGHEFLKREKDASIVPEGGGEEVTRNRLAFQYIRAKKRPLWTVDDLKAVFANKSPLNFPIGAIEIKANWTTKSGMTAWNAPAPVQPDMYQSLEGIGLNGLHIMAKIADTPNDPFTSSAPSWFWTTFEYYGNPGRDDAIKFITHHDALTAAEVEDLIGPAGIPANLAKNYRCNGTQIAFVDGGTNVVLGNTTMEGGFVLPASSPPSMWTKWNSSCHACHGQARMTNTPPVPPRFGFTPLAGEIPPPLVAGGWPLDFDWSIPDQAVPRPPQP